MNLRLATFYVFKNFVRFYKKTPEGIIANIWRSIFFYITVPKELRS